MILTYSRSGIFALTLTAILFYLLYSKQLLAIFKSKIFYIIIIILGVISEATIFIYFSIKRGKFLNV